MVMPLCIWTEDSDGTWDTQCNNRHTFFDGGPEENHYEYCPYCGKHLIEVVHEDD